MLARRHIEEGAEDKSPRSPRGTARPPSGSAPFGVGFLARLLLRLCGLAAVTVVYALPVAVSASFGLKRAPSILRSYLQACGGLFVKLGQVLALRYDLLPYRYCNELSKLLDDLPPVPTPVITKGIESALGRRLDEMFLRFEDKPLSCASVAQVHAAELLDGEAVVVKVVRPGSEVAFRADLWLVKIGANLLELLGIGAKLGVSRVARELEAFTREEFDLLRELRNAEILDAELRRDGVERAVPKMYPELSARSVLTMERIVGITVSQLIAATEARDEEKLADWRHQGINAEAVGILLLRSMLVQMFRHRTFHADPHSSNILIRPGGKLVFVDFGIFGWIDERQWSQQMRMRYALSANKIHAAYVALVADFSFPRGADVATFESEVKEILWSWSQASLSPHSTIRDKSAGTLFLGVFDAVRRAGASIPSGLLRFFRALVISDMVILKLNPGIDILGEVRKFLAEETVRLTVKTTARGVVSGPSTIARLAAEAPGLALETLEWLSELPAARGAPHSDPSPAGTGLVRVLLDTGALGAAVFTALAIAGIAFAHIPVFDEVVSKLGIDVVGHRLASVLVGLGSFAFLRRLAATVAR
jgi:ubiquinone biosynthesis protein